MKPFPRESRTRIKFTRGNIGMAHDIPDRVIPFQYPTRFHQCLDLHRRVGMPIGCTSLFNSREDFIRHDLFVEPSKPPLSPTMQRSGIIQFDPDREIVHVLPSLQRTIPRGNEETIGSLKNMTAAARALRTEFQS